MHQKICLFCIFENSFWLWISSLIILFMYCFSCKYVNIILKNNHSRSSNQPFTPLFLPF